MTVDREQGEIKQVDDGHKIQHKETEKPKMAMEIRKLWKATDERQTEKEGTQQRETGGTGL